MDLDGLIKSFNLQVLSKNRGQQLVLSRSDGLVVDYWPSSTKYIFRKSGTRGQGIASLQAKLSGGAEVAKIHSKPQVITEDEDKCRYCGEPSAISCHGTENGEVYSHYYCAKDYIKYCRYDASKSDLERYKVG